MSIGVSKINLVAVFRVLVYQEIPGFVLASPSPNSPTPIPHAPQFCQIAICVCFCFCLWCFAHCHCRIFLSASSFSFTSSPLLIFLTFCFPLILFPFLLPSENLPDVFHAATFSLITGFLHSLLSIYPHICFVFFSLLRFFDSRAPRFQWGLITFIFSVALLRILLFST